MGKCAEQEFIKARSNAEVALGAVKSIPDKIEAVMMATLALKPLSNQTKFNSLVSVYPLVTGSRHVLPACMLNPWCLQESKLD